jgi:hypothetical protein
MNKIDCIARKILGWKLNRWDRWYDYEKREFIQDSEFQPEENLTHAMRIVDRLEEFGYKYSINGPTEVRFNDISGTGQSLPQAITDAAYNIIEHKLTSYNNHIWRTLC